MRTFSWFIDIHLLAVTSQGRRGEGALLGLFYKYINPIHEGFALMTQSPPKAPALNNITLGIRFQHKNLGKFKHSVFRRGYMYIEHLCPFRCTYGTLILNFLKLNS